MPKFFNRIKNAFQTASSKEDWLYTLGLLIAFAVVYLPIGFSLGFLAIDVQTSWLTILGVVASAFVMPGVNEELIFRALLVPHPTEPITPRKRMLWALISLLLFIAYHVHPFTPLFFKTPAFLIGATLVGVVCTLAYWRRGSIWPAIVLHWLIVVVWLLGLGGLKKFSG